MNRKYQNIFGRKRGLKRRQTVLTVFVINYLAILIIPIIVGIFVYNHMQSTTKEEIIHSNYVKRVMISKQFDAQLAEVENLMSRIATGEKFADVLRMIQKDSTVSAYERSLLVQELKNAKFNIASIQDAYIYFHNADAVVSSTTTLNKALTYDVFHKNKEFSQEEWQEIMHRKHSREIRLMPTSQMNFFNMEEIVYLQTLPLGRSGEATLAIFLDKEYLIDVFNDMPDTDGDLIIADASGNMLAGSGDYDIQIDFLERAAKENELVPCEYNNERYVVGATQSSKISSLYYVSMIPEELLLSDVVRIRNLYMLAFALILIVGIISILYFSRRNVVPIHNMVKLVRKTMGSEDEEVSDDVRYVMTVMEKVKDRIFSTERNLRLKKQISKNYFLKELLTEDGSSEKFNYELALNNEVYCEAGKYIVILIYAYEYQGFFEDSDTLEKAEQENMVHLVISNVVTELFEEKYHCQSVNMGAFTTACIICAEENETETEKKICDVFENAYNFISTNFQMHFTVAVSTEHEFRNLNEAYSEAVAVACYGKPEDESLEVNIEFYQKSQEDKLDLEIIDESFERKFTNNLRGQKIEEAKKLLEELFSSHRVYTTEYGDMLKYDILMIMLKAIPIKSRNEFIEQMMPFKKLEKSRSVSAIENTFYSLLDAMEEFVYVEDTVTSKLCTDIIKYIQDCYSDINLSITNIADHFGLSSHYLSLQFKKETGERLKTYINFVRIEHAKEILLTTPKKINEIADMVGFIDNNAFIRVFKTFEGITPGKYREIANQENNED